MTTIPLLLKIAIYLSFLFMFSELILMVAKHSKRKSVSRQKDKGSLIILWIAISVSLTLGFNLANYGTWYFLDYLFASAGLVILIFGLLIRWTAIIQLNKAFTVDVAINSTHELKTDGLYEKVRHPSYLGLLLIITGEAVSTNSLKSVIVMILPVCLAIIYRMHVEEKLLEEEFGEVYLDYAQKTKSIIPFIY